MKTSKTLKISLYVLGIDKEINYSIISNLMCYLRDSEMQVLADTSKMAKE